MKPVVYVDLELRAGDPDGGTLPTPVLAGATLAVLHGVFRQMPGRYALALPKVLPGQSGTPGPVLRVFASGREDLDQLMAAISGHPVVRDYARLGYPRSVPTHWSEGVEYRRYRIPAQAAERNPNDPLRLRRMMTARQLGLPYFQLRSRSTGQQFTLYVQVLTGVRSSGACAPDSYGLSVSSRPFVLPLLSAG